MVSRLETLVNQTIEEKRLIKLLANLIKDAEDGKKIIIRVTIDRETEIVNLDGITLDFVPTNVYTCSFTFLEVNQ